MSFSVLAFNRAGEQMGPFEVVVVIFFIATVGKVIQSLAATIGQGDRGVDRDRIRSLEAMLRTNEARLTQTEEKLGELGEKLDFIENLLASPESSRRLPGGEAARDD